MTKTEFRSIIENISYFLDRFQVFKISPETLCSEISCKFSHGDILNILNILDISIAKSNGEAKLFISTFNEDTWVVRQKLKILVKIFDLENDDGLLRKQEEE